MPAEFERTKRLLAMTRQLENQARARLAAVQAEATAAARSREVLLAALIAEHPLHGLFPAARARRLAAIAAEEQRLAAAQAACAQELVALEGRRRMCERMLDASAAALRRQEEARHLDELISRLAARKHAIRGKPVAPFSGGNGNRATMVVSQPGPGDPVRRPAQGAPPARAEAGGDAARAFEAIILRQSIEIMLPRTGQSLFGGGFAGETWRSMLAERLAEALAQVGGTGIAQAVAPSLAPAAGAAAAYLVRDGAGEGP